MQIFYSINANTTSEVVVVEGQEHIHLSKVLRKSIGEIIYICNGKGQLFEGEILSISKKNSQIKLNKILVQEEKPPLLSVAIAPTKNIARIEWFVEKSVELGIGDIYLFTHKNSERKNVKIERLQLKAISAMKQSKNLWLPKIHSLQKWNEVLSISKNYEQKFIAYCEEKTQHFAQQVKNNENAIVYIGAEGGFAPSEIEQAKAYAIKPISLGKNRLRTETAALFAVSIFALEQV